MNAATLLLGGVKRVLDILTDVTSECALSPQPCRTGLYPAGEVPLDTCGDDCAGAEGMLWGNLQTSSTTGNTPGCTRVVWTAQIGITRCSAPAGPTGIPTVESVEANAWQQALDADTIANVILCCPEFAPQLPGDHNHRDHVTLTSWAPIDNQGVCYGGVWTVTGVYDSCCG